MSSKKYLTVACMVFMLAGGTMATSFRAAAPPRPESGHAVWKLEHAYWGYVEKNDLPDYRKLWHKNFLGWPSVSAVPVRKDHITEWITSQTIKGLTLKTVELKPVALEVTGAGADACFVVSA